MIRLLKNCLFIGIWLLIIISAPIAHASTDPLDATASATATVPSLSVTGDHDAPSIPILIRPVDGTVTGDNRPEFVWKSSSDTGSNTIIYTLYLNSVATYLGISNLGNSSGHGFTARLDGIETKLTVTIPLLDGIYNWYVTATDPSGNTSQSTSWNLTIDTIPPLLSVIDIDTYHNPVIIEGANFDIDGPKDVHFTVLSDPYVDIQITITDDSSTIYNLRSTTSLNGLAYLYQHLTPGVYSVTILAIDRAGNITVLPNFTLTIHQSSLIITIPGTTEPIINIPYTPLAVLPPSFPATVSFVASRGILSYLFATLLAIIILILLIILWRRKYNLILLNPQFRPLPQATIYHSNPYHHLPSTIHDLRSIHRGRLFIPHLSRYSTLTIRVQGNVVYTTYILSISAKSRVYTLILG